MIGAEPTSPSAVYRQEQTPHTLRWGEVEALAGSIHEKPGSSYDAQTEGAALIGLSSSEPVACPEKPSSFPTPEKA